MAIVSWLSILTCVTIRVMGVPQQYTAFQSRGFVPSGANYLNIGRQGISYRRRVLDNHPYGARMTAQSVPQIRYLTPKVAVSSRTKQLLKQGLVSAMATGLTFGNRQLFAIDTNADIIIAFGVCDVRGVVYDSFSGKKLGAVARGVPSLNSLNAFVRGRRELSRFRGLGQQIHRLGKSIQAKSRCITGCGAFYRTGDPFILDCAGNLIVGNAVAEPFKGLVVIRDTFSGRAVGYLTKISQVALKSPLLAAAVSATRGLAGRGLGVRRGVTGGYVKSPVPRNAFQKNGYLRYDQQLAYRTNMRGYPSGQNFPGYGSYNGLDYSRSGRQTLGGYNVPFMKQQPQRINYANTRNPTFGTSRQQHFGTGKYTYGTYGKNPQHYGSYGQLNTAFSNPYNTATAGYNTNTYGIRGSNVGYLNPSFTSGNFQSNQAFQTGQQIPGFNNFYNTDPYTGQLAPGYSQVFGQGSLSTSQVPLGLRNNPYFFNNAVNARLRTPYGGLNLGGSNTAGMAAALTSGGRGIFGGSAGINRSQLGAVNLFDPHRKIWRK